MPVGDVGCVCTALFGCILFAIGCLGRDQHNLAQLILTGCIDHRGIDETAGVPLGLTPAVAAESFQPLCLLRLPKVVKQIRSHRDCSKD